MTKLRTTFIVITLLAVLLCGLLPAGVALADVTPIVLLSGKAEDNRVVVTVNLRNNEGISAMMLTLDYDRERLVLTGFEQGEALSTLDLVTTNVEGTAGYGADPFRFNWMGDDNDSSNGRLLTLYFAPVGDSEGKARVTFTYKRDTDVNYIEAGDVRTRNLMMDTLQIDLSKGEVTDIVSDIDPATASPAHDNTTALAVGLTLAGVTVVSLGIGLPLLWRKKHK